MFAECESIWQFGLKQLPNIVNTGALEPLLKFATVTNGNAEPIIVRVRYETLFKGLPVGYYSPLSKKVVPNLNYSAFFTILKQGLHEIRRIEFTQLLGNFITWLQPVVDSMHVLNAEEQAQVHTIAAHYAMLTHAIELPNVPFMKKLKTKCIVSDHQAKLLRLIQTEVPEQAHTLDPAKQVNLYLSAINMLLEVPGPVTLAKALSLLTKATKLTAPEQLGETLGAIILAHQSFPGYWIYRDLWDLSKTIIL